MKHLFLTITLFQLLVFPLKVVASEPGWSTPLNNKFKNIKQSDRIIPLGFSKKGVFSYLLQTNSCNKPGDYKQDVSWIAINLIKDKKLKQVKLGMAKPDISSIKLMQKYGKNIEEHNANYGVITNKSFNIDISREINSGNDTFTIQTKLVETGIGEDAINPGYRKYAISLISEKRGIKKIAEIKSVYEPLRYWGYIKSPFEERIATFFLSDFRGCDAFPQMRINIVGASLKYGFSPVKPAQ